ncbi:MAG: phage integrase SAM-like domain-containing protein [Chlorobi bacterium]|nr:phage integrase SAM-like domain-containing protein [Chlorobiota bacterium]
MGLKQSRRRTDRWFLPLSNPYTMMGYCYERHDLAYLFVRVDSKTPRIRKCLKLQWRKQSKPIAMDLLNKQIIAELTTEKREPEEKDLQLLMIEFLKIHSDQLSKPRKSLFKKAIDHFVKDNMLLSDVTEIRDQIIGYMKNSKLHNNTIRNHYKALRQIFDYAVSWGYMQINPLPKSLMPKEIVKEVVVLKDGENKRLPKYFRSEAKRLLKTEPKDQRQARSMKLNAEAMEGMADLTEFINYVGSRITETLKLTWNDVDDKKITILGKGNKKREFPISPFPQLASLLKRMKANRNGDKLFRWKSSQNPTKKLNEAIQILNIDVSGKRGFHILRKTRINELIRIDSSAIAIIAIIFGQTIEVIQRYYLEIFGAEKTAEILSRKGKSKLFS